MRDDLPTGTVTFLFTDVAGSTRLLEALGPDRYADELGRHREVVRGALAQHGGVEVDTQGDAFFCAFASARAAVACATSIRDDLEGGPIQVRMGLHTGEALVADGHYVGMDVHRAARIGACGSGGQVVLSPSTAALLEPGDAELRDLGPHRLKDLASPVVLFQLGGGDFPPLATLHRTNLPVPTTLFLGRVQELEELSEVTRTGDVRLLTLTGAGGTGKTRLALQLAAELSDGFPDGVWWAPLASLRDPGLVASAVAGVLDVEEEPDRALSVSIASSLAHRRAILLLDNCEHVLDAVGDLAAEIVARCRDVLVLATSREPLRLTGEHVFPVQPLGTRDAVELFHARARSAGARLDEAGTRGLVTELCARLDNLPLAVELAAARAAVLPPAALLDRLGGRLDVLRGPRDVEERQRTLRAAIAWSHDLLGPGEQTLFRQLAVFAGGASLAAVEGVCDADLEDLLSLVAKSLVRQASAEDEPRYWMLETIRDFAAEELEAAGEGDGLRDRHLDWFSRLARRLRPELDGPESGERLAELERDLDNLRAAFAWGCVREADGREDALALAFALRARHFLRGRYAEAEDVVRAALALGPDELAAAALQARLAGTLRLQNRPGEALAALVEAEALLEGVEARHEAWWRAWIDLKLTQAHFFYFQNEQASLERVVAELEPVMAPHGTDAQRIELLHVRAQHAYRQERYVLSDETEELIREVYGVSSAAGEVDAEFMLGFGLLWRGKLDEAEEHLARGREVARSRGAALVETRCVVYGMLARRLRSDVEAVRTVLLELEEQEELHGYRGLVAANAAWVAYRDGDHETALGQGEVALLDWRTEGRLGSSVFHWTARFPMLGAELARGNAEGALAHVAAMLAETQQPLPPELAAPLEQALAGDVAALERALECARSRGYA